MTHETFTPRAGVALAYRRVQAARKDFPGVLFLGGFMSDMTGTKAAYLEDRCRARGQAYVHFDYEGHGASSGAFTACNIGLWLQDALDVFDALTDGPHIIVGSSMGGWIALLLALRRKERVAGLIGLAPAPDFTADIYNTVFTDNERRAIEKGDTVFLDGGYGDPYPLTRQLFDDAKKFLLLNAAIDVACPVRIIHGKNDAAVPWQKSLTIKEKLTSQDVAIAWVEDGDHRLSRDQDLALIDRTIEELSVLKV